MTVGPLVSYQSSLCVIHTSVRRDRTGGVLAAVSTAERR